jgi:flagellar protein FlgJ
MEKHEFIARAREAAEAAARVHGAQINVEVVTAMAAHETGFGTSALVKYSNLLGIKAGKQWAGPTVNLATFEYEPPGAGGNAYDTRAHWRVYGSWIHCFRDYGEILDRLWWFRDARDAKDDPLAFLLALLPIYGPDGKEVLEPGHATDPKYQQLILDIMREHQLLDQPSPSIRLDLAETNRVSRVFLADMEVRFNAVGLVPQEDGTAKLFIR